ncbi:ABC transporter permease [Kitasatospora sp. NPDC050543]|uniref:ABC transporter permease n=1 Tax=Kitasatospora sp. NPDC050543 TaxID=3364054 RepID=UPI0037A7666F
MASFVRLQWLLLIRSPRLLATLVVLPLYALVLFGTVRAHPSPELAATVTLGVFLMSMWSQAMFVAAEVVGDDRWDGTLEPSLLTPRAYVLSLVIRVLTTTALSVPALFEVMAIGRFGYGLHVTVHHPLVAAVTVVLLVVGTSGSALLVSGLMVVAPGSRSFQNALTYPFYILGGLILPVTSLPEPVSWLSRLFFLSWGTDLLRAAFAGGPLRTGGLLVLLALSAAQLALGVALLGRALARARDGRARLYA